LNGTKALGKSNRSQWNKQCSLLATIVKLLRRSCIQLSVVVSSFAPCFYLSKNATFLGKRTKMTSYFHFPSFEVLDSVNPNLLQKIKFTFSSHKIFSPNIFNEKYDVVIAIFISLNEMLPLLKINIQSAMTNFGWIFFKRFVFLWLYFTSIYISNFTRNVVSTRVPNDCQERLNFVWSPYVENIKWVEYMYAILLLNFPSTSNTSNVKGLDLLG